MLYVDCAKVTVRHNGCRVTDHVMDEKWNHIPVQIEINEFLKI